MSEFTRQSRESYASVPDFQEKIDAITSRALTPENINIYADTALDDLVTVVRDITDSYDKQPSLGYEIGTEHERASFEYFGLDANDIEVTLDHIADKAEEIRGLDALMNRINMSTGKIITPPNDNETVLALGSGTFGENRRTTPRLKTVLFVLANKFDIDLENPDECSILTGTVSDYMIRKEPYHLVTLPTLNREILVCDEMGNATFIFDREKLLQSGKSRDELIAMDKDSIDEYLDLDPDAGRKLKYSNLFTEKIASLLEDLPVRNSEIIINDESSKLLRPKEVSDETKTMNATAKDLNVTRDAVKKALAALRDELGDVSSVKLTNGVTEVYSTEQQSLIREWLGGNGYLAQKAPEGFLTVKKLADSFSIGETTLRKAIDSVELGDVLFARVNTNRTNVYSPEQQQIIHKWLAENGYAIANTEDTEGFRTIKALDRELGISENTLRNLLEKHADIIGKPTPTKAGVHTVDGYSSEQQQVLRALLEASGHLAPPAPEGWLTKRQFSQTSGYSSHAVEKAINFLGDSLGEPTTARVGKTALRPRGVYSPDQQFTITEWLRENGYKPTNSNIGSFATSSVFENLPASP